MRGQLTIRIGDDPNPHVFDTLDKGIEFLNECCVGQVINWRIGSFETVNFHGDDRVQIYWVTDSGGCDLSQEEKQRVDRSLIEVYL